MNVGCTFVYTYSNIFTLLQFRKYTSQITKNDLVKCGYKKVQDVGREHEIEFCQSREVMLVQLLLFRPGLVIAPL